MQQLRKRRADHAQTSRAHTQADVDIVVGNGQVVLLEPADSVEHLAPHRHAGAGHRGHAARVAQHAAIAWVIARRTAQQMRCHRAGPQRQAGVLHRAVRIQQPRADHADRRTQCQCHHFVQPIGMQCLDIVVEQHKDFAARKRHGGVVHRRPVERAWVTQHAHALIGRQTR